MELTGKVVIITGASSGIGLETARLLAAAGARLVLAARTAAKLDAAINKVTAAGIEAIAVPTDVTSAANCEALAHAAVQRFGTIDVLINNAGFGPPASIVETTEEIWDATIDSCLKGVFLMTRAVLPTMLAKQQGTIVNISSVAAKGGFPNRAAYCAAKWGVHGFTEALRAEVGEQNIHAHLICPAVVATPWWGTSNAAQPPEVLERMVQPQEVAEAVRWVLTQPARIRIDEIVVDLYKNPWQK
ncbi:MAG: SDR family oxidoreductase [Caldilineaceae bacterium]|nr:SDR family oxidoreductase [Caldilineaceae bacterium]